MGSRGVAIFFSIFCLSANCLVENLSDDILSVRHYVSQPKSTISQKIKVAQKNLWNEKKSVSEHCASFLIVGRMNATCPSERFGSKQSCFSSAILKYRYEPILSKRILCLCQVFFSTPLDLYLHMCMYTQTHKHWC